MYFCSKFLLVLKKSQPYFQPKISRKFRQPKLSRKKIRLAGSQPQKCVSRTSRCLAIKISALGSTPGGKLSVEAAVFPLHVFIFA